MAERPNAAEIGPYSRPAGYNYSGVPVHPPSVAKPTQPQDAGPTNYQSVQKQESVDQEKNKVKNEVKSEKPDPTKNEIKNELPQKSPVLGKRTPTENENNSSAKKQKVDDAAAGSDSDSDDSDIFNKNKNKT